MKNKMLQLLKQNLKTIDFVKKGQIIQGKVLEKKRNKIYFDLGSYGIGVCYKNEFYESKESIKDLNISDEVKLKVLDPDNEEGLVEVSLRRVGEMPIWNYIEKLIKTKEKIKVKILGANRGGLLTKVRNVDAFLPTSQLTKEHYPDVGGDPNKILQRLKQFIGKELTVSVLGIEPNSKKLILSEKIDELELINKKLKKYKVGDIIEGEVRGIVDYGIFVRFDEVIEGLVHISELDWQLIEHPKDLYKIGQKVKAKIIGIKDDQVSLSIKQLLEDPWQKVSLKEGEILKGKVSRIKSYGIVVNIMPKIHGLIPASRFKNSKEIMDKFQVGKEYEFKVISFEPKKHRLIIEPKK